MAELECSCSPANEASIGIHHFPVFIITYPAVLPVFSFCHKFKVKPCNAVSSYKTDNTNCILCYAAGSLDICQFTEVEL